MSNIQGFERFEKDGNSGGVKVRETASGFALVKDGELYYIKGAGGYTNLRLLKLSGANSIRVWDTTNLQTILDSAFHYGLSVAVGIDIGHVKDGFDYMDEKSVQAQFDRARRTVLKYKDHPAVLMWVVGNELASWRCWLAVDDIAEMIHELDPLHPNTTTMINFQRKNSMLIKWLCPNIDILSINTFGALPNLPAQLNHWLWGWRGPYIVMEWGNSGKWEVATTDWGSPIEDPSTKKAELILDRYTRFCEQADKRCLGNYIFYWGQKNEATPTWFSMFTPHGYSTAEVGVAQQIWQGMDPLTTYPQINYMLVDGKGAHSSIKLKAGGEYTSELFFHDSVAEDFLYQYALFSETAFPAREEGDSLDFSPIYQTDFIKAAHKHLFKAPNKKGAYRLLVYVLNGEAKAATTNVPFFVFE